DEQWDSTEAAIEEALRLNEIPYTIAPGEGAFYGPKIDLHMEDVLGRKWQMGTIQLDSQMPSRFGLTYIGADNREHPLYVVHRALYGSFERFIGILIEHFAGDFPYWLAPVQVRVLPVQEEHRTAAGELVGKLKEAGVRAEQDERDETVGKRIREAELQKVPFTIVYGDRESDESLAVRERGGGQSTQSLAELLARFRELGNAVLLGSASFWEGVDVPGAALSVVIIDKLPFAPPDDPLFAARLDELRAEGGNPFFDYQLPQAVIALKQGAGRLIRTETDRGVLMICDPRLTDKPYGRRIWKSLPPMRRTRELGDVEAFFKDSAPAQARG
ncbi:MAG TPA: helicase C-terminal domain-containing protein, partial [Casimicrobiaceae bacterium]|nr:helicase C-terminal domain-containing protein [Casimicrobiaceae bacterium]